MNNNSLAILEKWGCEIDPELLVMALTHRSFAHEHNSEVHNERLEFLGDAVLQMIVTEHLFTKYPDHPEGHLAKMRAATVSQKPLAQIARQIGLGDFILLGKGENQQRGREKASILSDTVEAMIGATYMCHGWEVTRKVVLKLVDDLLAQALERGAAMDWKTTLQELCYQKALGEPEYETSWTGPDHKRRYTSKSLVNGETVGRGQGTSKKLAEHEAAQQATMYLREKYNITTPLGF